MLWNPEHFLFSFIHFFSNSFLLISFINHFYNFTPYPGKRKKGEKNGDLIKCWMIRKNNNIQHCDKEHDKTDKNSIGYFSIFNDDSRCNATDGSSQSGNKQKEAEECLIIFHAEKKPLPVLKRSKSFKSYPLRKRPYTKSNNKPGYTKTNQHRNCISYKIH